MPQLESNYPWGIELTSVFFQPQLVENSVSSFMNNLFQAVAIVMLIMLAFLGFRTGLIVSLLIPMTIAVTFVLMKSFDITINQISLAALIIALGLLVDNAIVIVESILVRREQGQDAVSAAIASGNELAIPLLISSLTTAAAFLSIFLAESAVGEYTTDIFKVNTIALLSSWVLAMTIIPLLSKSMIHLKQKKEKVSYQGVMYQTYRKILIPALKYRIVFLLLVMFCFGSAIAGLKYVKKVFIPPRTDPIVNAKFNMPRGTAIETTEKIIADIEGFMRQNLLVTDADITNGKRGLRNWASFIGEGAPRYTLSADPEPRNPHHASLLLTTTDHLVIPEIIEKVTTYCQRHYPDLKVQMKKLANGKPIDFPVSIRVSGKEFNQLYTLITPIKEKLASLSGVMNIEDDWGPRSKKLMIDVNQEQARRVGVIAKPT
jgi:multidrug efflux pump subunit AcrB